MGECRHERRRKNGRDRYGKQRYRCNDCGRTFKLDKAGVPWEFGDKVIVRLKEDKQNLLQRLIDEGEKSQRQIARIVGCSKMTVMKRVQARTAEQPAIKNAKQDECDFCGTAIHLRKEFHRRTARTKRKFCSQECYTKMQNWEASQRKCIRCSVLIWETTSRKCTRGMCDRCYHLMKRNLFDEQLSELDELTKTLKKESKR